MTRNPIRRSGLVLLSLLLPLSPLSAEDEKDLRELLRDALYTEEVTRDPEAAAKQYEALLSQHDAQRAFAASALFRLAEVRRKQDRKEESIALYQKFLSRFPEAETEAKLARESLAALGGKLPSADAPVTDPDDDYIRHLRKIAEASPDQLQEKFLGEVNSGKPKVVEFLISQGADPKTPKALTAAAETGNLAVCKILLHHGKPSPEETGNALAMAAFNDRSAVLSYLLDQGLDPNSPASWTNGVVVSPLMVAIEGGRANAAKTLVDHGANVDFMVQSEGYPVSAIPFASALHHVVWSRNPAMFKLLLEWGAKPDLPSPKAGISPLHLAASINAPIGEVMVKELLARGADPNRKTTLPPPDTRKSDQAPREFALVTPLEIALGNESGAAIVEAMLAKGASANLLNRDGDTLLTDAVQGKKKERLKLLLKAHADPDVADRRGWTPLMYAAHTNDQDAAQQLLDAGADPNKGHDGETPLSIATKSGGGWSIASLLFAKGAKPETATFEKALTLSEWDFALKLLEAGAPLPAGPAEPTWNTPLVIAAKSERALPLIEKMIEMGVKPDDSWIKSGFAKGFYPGITNEVDRSVRPLLFRRFMLPTLEESSDVRIAIDDSGYMRVGVLDDLSGDLTPRPLAQSLLEPAEASKSDWRIILSDRLTVWRKSADGWTVVAEQSFGATDEFPILRRGDVIEVTDGPDPEQLRSKDTMEVGFTAELRWKLRQRVSFPVTLEIDGKAVEIKMRGDRLIHDPTSTDLPWCSAGTLAALRWKPGWTLGPETGMSVVVTRKNWPEVRLPFPSNEASNFSLKSGDHVKLETPSQAIDAMTAMRKKSVGFRAAGLPYGRMIECAGGNNLARDGRSFPPPLIPSMVPTLCQLIAETQVVPSTWTEFSALPPEAVPVRFPASSSPTAVLPHPDWSRVRILRLKEDGSEEAIEVNLARMIDETNANATVDEVKKHDVQLQPGDIVELRVHEDRLGQPWKGLSAKEESFLAKATEGKVQVIGDDAKIDLKEIRFRAPVFVETPAGWIPLPRKPGTQSVRASTLMGQRIRIEMTRDGEAYDDVDPSLVFLRDGDQLKKQPPGGSPRPRPSIIRPPAR